MKCEPLDRFLGPLSVVSTRGWNAKDDGVFLCAFLHTTDNRVDIGHDSEGEVNWPRKIAGQNWSETSSGHRVAVG